MVNQRRLAIINHHRASPEAPTKGFMSLAALIAQHGTRSSALLCAAPGRKVLAALQHGHTRALVFGYRTPIRYSICISKPSYPFLDMFYLRPTSDAISSAGAIQSFPFSHTPVGQESKFLITQSNPEKHYGFVPRRPPYGKILCSPSERCGRPFT